MTGRELEDLAAVVEKQRSVAAGAGQLGTWRGAVIGMGEPEPVRQWQLGESVPEDEEGLGSGEQQRLVVRRLWVRMKSGR